MNCRGLINSWMMSQQKFLKPFCFSMPTKNSIIQLPNYFNGNISGFHTLANQKYW